MIRIAACFPLLALLSPSLFGEGRQAWISSKVAGSPDPNLPYVAEVVFPNLTFNSALDLAWLEPEGRLFLAERNGRILSVPDDLSADPHRADLSVDLKDHIVGFENNRGLTFHPRFATNRQIFIHYIVRLPNREQEGRISRFLLDKGWKIDPATEEIIITFGGAGHSGGHLLFGPDGMLYFGVGDNDAPSPPDHKNVGQDISNLASTIVRIDVDRRDEGRAYHVPDDNPFLGTKGARSEIWAFGFRNPWKLTFSPHDGSLWTGDVGWEMWEMVYRVERGANYGWPIMEGPAPLKTQQERGPAPISPPTHYYSHVEGASVTGGYFLQSDRLPELKGAYLYGDYETGRIWALRHDGNTVTENREIANTRLRIVSFGMAPGGDVVFLDFPDDRHLYRLVPNPDLDKPSTFPTRLSQTGLFASTTTEQPADGVYEFSIHAPMWNDGATSRYWVGIPGNGTIEARHQKRRGSPVVKYEKPEGTVLAKTISRDGRRIETQLLHYDGLWHGYTYRWNENHSDAVLVPKDGLEATIDGAPWRFQSRAECIRCHNCEVRWPLAFYPGQLDREGQLERFQELDLIDRKFVEAAAFQPIANPRDLDASLESRARSWLHTNCSGCHRHAGGGGITARMDVAVANGEMDLLDQIPTKGSFGLDDAKLIAPGDPYRSALYYRIATTGAGHMPMLGCRTLDREGVQVVHDWIRSLAPDTAVAAPKTPPTTVAEAMALYHRVSSAGLAAEERARAIEACLASENPFIQNLFEAFRVSSEEDQAAPGQQKSSP